MLHFPSAFSCNKTGVLQWLAGVLSLMLQQQRNGNKESYSGVFLFLAVSVLVEIIALKKKTENDFRTLSAESGGDGQCWSVIYLILRKKNKLPLYVSVGEKNSFEPSSRSTLSFLLLES